MPKQTHPQCSYSRFCKAKPEYSLLLQYHVISFIIQTTEGFRRDPRGGARVQHVNLHKLHLHKPTTTFNASNWVLDVLTLLVCISVKSTISNFIDEPTQRKHACKCYYTVILSAAGFDAPSKTGLKRMRELQHSVNRFSCCSFVCFRSRLW